MKPFEMCTSARYSALKEKKRRRRRRRKKSSAGLWYDAESVASPAEGVGPSWRAVMENNVFCVYKRRQRKDNKTVGGEEDQNIALTQEHL